MNRLLGVLLVVLVCLMVVESSPLNKKLKLPKYRPFEELLEKKLQTLTQTWYGVNAPAIHQSIGNKRATLTRSDSPCVQTQNCTGSTIQLTQAQITEILAVHNGLRANLTNPYPQNPLPQFTWNQDLANIWTLNPNNCQFQHISNEQRSLYYSQLSGQPNNTAIGENLAQTYSYFIVNDQFITNYAYNFPGLYSGWGMEKDCYTYSPVGDAEICNETCYRAIFSDGCGHYTQQIWEGSTQLGCLIINCTNFPTNSSQNGFQLVCDYLPAGNYIGQYPYVALVNPTPTSNPSPTSSPSLTSSRSVSLTSSVSLTRTATPSISLTTTATPSTSLTRTATPSTSLTATATASTSTSRTATASISLTTVASQSFTPSTTTTATPSISTTSTASISATSSVSVSPSRTPSTTHSMSLSTSASVSESQSAQASPASGSSSASVAVSSTTASQSGSASQSTTASRSGSASPSTSASQSRSASPSTVASQSGSAPSPSTGTGGTGGNAGTGASGTVSISATASTPAATTPSAVSNQTTSPSAVPTPSSSPAICILTRRVGRQNTLVRSN